MVGSAPAPEKRKHAESKQELGELKRSLGHTLESSPVLEFQTQVISWILAGPRQREQLELSLLKDQQMACDQEGVLKEISTTFLKEAYHISKEKAQDVLSKALAAVSKSQERLSQAVRGEVGLPCLLCAACPAPALSRCDRWRPDSASWKSESLQKSCHQLGSSWLPTRKLSCSWTSTSWRRPTICLTSLPLLWVSCLAESCMQYMCTLSRAMHAIHVYFQ